MCYFITAVLPAGAPIVKARQVAEQHGRNLVSVDNPSIQAHLRAGEQYFLTTAGHCDCETSLGAMTRTRRPHQSKSEERARRMAARGWSKAKIERALAQSAQTQDRASTRAEELAAADVESWVSLAAALKAEGIPYIGLLLHFYDGPLSEDLALRGREVVQSASMVRQTLPRIAADTLYELRTEA
jgi:hypothetical protein